MGSNSNSPTPDPDEAKGAFRKPANDAGSRKYRRRSSASPSGSPDESPKQDLRLSPTLLKEDKRRKLSTKDDRVSSRGDHGSQGYNRSSDHTRGGKYVDEEDRSYARLSSRSGRDSRGGAYSDYKERGGDYNRPRDYYHHKDKYNRDNRDKYDDRDRRGRDRDYRDEKEYGRSSRDYKSDRIHITSCEESMRKQDDSLPRRENNRQKEADKSDSKAEDRSKHLNDENKKYDEVDCKESRGRFQDDAPANRNEETGVKRSKLSGFDRTDPTTGSNQGQDLVKDTPGQAVVTMPGSAGNLDAAKVAAMKAAELVNKNLGSTGVMTADQKKKLLWGNKKNTSTEESSHRWDSSIFPDRERQEKFNKLMSLRLPWYVWRIVGREGRSEVSTESKQRPGSNRQAKRTSDGFRKAIHSWTSKKRWTHSRVGSLGVCAVTLVAFVTPCNQITSSFYVSKIICHLTLYLFDLVFGNCFGPFFHTHHL